MAKRRGQLLDGFKTDRKAKRYAKGVMTAIQGKKLYRSYVEAILGAAYFNGHQSGEVVQIGKAYPLHSPKIVTLCGPTKFTSEMLKEAWRLTISGVIVIHWNILESKEAFSHGAEAAGGNVKEIVDGLYLHKVAMADEVRVINVGGYIGESTRAELRHARKLGKPITWLESGKVDKEFA